MPTNFPVCINCCMYCTSQGPSRWLVRSPAPLSALQQQDPEMVCWHCFPAAQRKILWIPPGVTLCWGRSSHCWIDACSVLVYTCCNPSHVLFDLMHLGASLIWLNVIIHYLQVRNVFAKLITLLCYLTNKDPPFEVEVTTNAGRGECVASCVQWTTSLSPATCFYANRVGNSWLRPWS